jgi:hypothetical protein
MVIGMYKPLLPYEFNMLGIYNYKIPGPLDLFYNFIRLCHNTLPGDIVEAGVFKGRTLLATALLLRDLDSSKIIYAYDSFGGFPDPHSVEKTSLFDDMDSFERQFGNNCGRSHHRRLCCSDDWHQLVKRRSTRCESRGCESGVCELR